MAITPLRTQPEVMTGRAQAYLVIAAIRHLLLGGFCVFAADTFKSSSFIPIKETLPLPVWGFVFVAAGLVCAAAAIRRQESLARLGLIMSATTTLVWTVGLTLAVITGDLSSPSGPIVWWAVTFKDYVVCAQPMRSPFEPLVRAVRAEGAVKQRRR